MLPPFLGKVGFVSPRGGQMRSHGRPTRVFGYLARINGTLGVLGLPNNPCRSVEDLPN